MNLYEHMMNESKKLKRRFKESFEAGSRYRNNFPKKDERGIPLPDYPEGSFEIVKIEDDIAYLSPLDDSGKRWLNDVYEDAKSMYEYEEDEFAYDLIKYYDSEGLMGVDIPTLEDDSEYLVKLESKKKVVKESLESEAEEIIKYHDRRRNKRSPEGLRYDIESFLEDVYDYTSSTGEDYDDVVDFPGAPFDTEWLEPYRLSYEDGEVIRDYIEMIFRRDYSGESVEESKKRVSEPRTLSKSSRKRVNEATYDYTVTIKPKNTKDPEERFTGNSVEDLKRIVKNNVISKDEIVSVQGCSIDDLFEESKNLDEGRSDMIRDARSRRKSRDQLRQTQGSDRSMVSAISRLGKKYLRDYGDRLNDDALALYELVDTSDNSSEMMRALDELSKCKLVINSDPYSLVYSIGASSSGTSSAIIDPSDDGSPSIIIDLFSVDHWMFVNEDGDVFWCNDGGLGGTRPEDAPDRYKIFDGSSKEFTSFYSDFENSKEGQGDDYFIDYYRGLRALLKNTTEGTMSQIEEILDEYDKDIPLDDDEFDLLDDDEDYYEESKKLKRRVKEDFEYDETSEEDRGIYDWISTRVAGDIFYKFWDEFNNSEEQDFMEAVSLLVKVYKSMYNRQKK